MADLESLALKKDRGYLLRLALFLIAAVGAGLLMFAGLTGQQTSGCIAGALVGTNPNAKTPTE